MSEREARRFRTRCKLDRVLRDLPVLSTDNLMHWVYWTIGVIVALVIMVVSIGAVLPVAHTASRTVHLPYSSSQIYSIISDVQHYPAWRSGIQSVEILPHDSHLSAAWREHDSHGSMGYDAIEAVPDTRFVTHITDKGIPFGGGWTFQLTPEANGTSLTITENGEVYNPFFRFVSRFILGHHKSIDTYLADLTRKLDQK
jgi:hypothetical protein